MDSASYNRKVQEICDLLQERRAILFLGAGINAGVRTSSGELFPFSSQLANDLDREFLAGAGDTKRPLSFVAGVVEANAGRDELDKFLQNRLNGYIPGAAHLALVQLPWDAIYTTNYDLLVESAAKNSAISTPWRIRSIVSSGEPTDSLDEQDIPYYKLHGSLDLARTEFGRLIITNDDYQYYLDGRLPLLKRLKLDLETKSCVFVGYSLSDVNVASIVTDISRENGIKGLPKSYLVTPHFDRNEEQYWYYKHNIVMVPKGAETFLSDLHAAWQQSERSVLTPDELRERFHARADSTASFERISQSYYAIQPQDCMGQAEPQRFFRGGSPLWADIAQGIAPHRSVYWSVLAAVLPELTDPGAPPTFSTVYGAAGTGKTTLLKSLALELSQSKDLDVLWHIPGAPLEFRHVAHRIDRADTQRIVVFIDNCGDYLREVERFLFQAKEQGVPITVIGAERQHLWTIALSSYSGQMQFGDFELGALDQIEIDSILDALEKYSCLGRLSGMPIDVRRSHFEAQAHNDLLVALRELTEGHAFDDIIREEFEQIPNPEARDAYGYIAAIGQIELYMRQETLARLVGLNYAQLREKVYQPTSGILIDVEEKGGTRHNFGYRIRTRHPVIASIIFSEIAPSDDEKLELLLSIIELCDRGHREDLQLLKKVASDKRLVETIGDPEKRRAIYSALERMLPDDGYIFQQRSSLERDLGDGEAAVRYARLAVRSNPRALPFKNTLGLALERAARDEPDSIKAATMLREAKGYFIQGLRTNRADPFSHLGLINVARQEINRESILTRRERKRVELFALVEEAFEDTNEHSIIAGIYAEEVRRSGKPDEALVVLKNALDDSPLDSRIRNLLIRILIDNGDLLDAKEVAEVGLKLNATDWRLQRSYGRVLAKTGADASAVQGAYDFAIRHHAGDFDLIMEGAIANFYLDNVSRSRELFAMAKQCPVPADRKRRWRRVSGHPNQNGEKRYIGRVHRIYGATAEIVAIPENFVSTCPLTSTRLMNIQTGDAVEFELAFNAYGAQAIIR